MSAIHGKKAGRFLCEVLGLDPDKVVDITIQASLNEVLTARVVMLVDAEEVTVMADGFRKYRWRTVEFEAREND